LWVTVRLRRGQFPPSGVSVFERNLRPEARGRLHGDGARLVLAPGLAEHPSGPIADEHPPIAKRPGAERLPKVEIPLAPGKPQGARHTVEVLTDRREITALADFIRQKREHALRQGWRRGE
jgi:hypothetical protein